MATLPDCPVRWLTYGNPKTVRKLGEQGNKAVLGWVMKEGLIPSRYECQKCKKDMLLVERKGTIDGFEWRCRVQSKENPHFVCRSVRKGGSEVWKKFIENLITCYKSEPYKTIDEQLFSSKARCPFTQHMSSKPDKFGIKFWLVSDVDSKYEYMLNGFPYLGKDDKRPGNLSLSQYVVLRLIESFENIGRNTTMHNFFTTLNRSKMLKMKSTSLTGTMKRNWKEVQYDLA
ncbi:piggyBac transposable element-derived protein 4 [Trichonephila clavipes]|nr:piggyBac transposable element-derived protein 4 [Trichonephila clavipes]